MVFAPVSADYDNKCSKSCVLKMKQMTDFISQNYEYKMLKKTMRPATHLGSDEFAHSLSPQLQSAQQ
jgi:hypothetical protein